MIKKNAMNIVSMIERELGCGIFDRRYIFHREHTIPFTSDEISKLNISEWKTKKSVAKLFNDISKVTIIDDEIFKIVEKDRAIIVPTFTDHNVHQDFELEKLVRHLLNFLIKKELQSTKEMLKLKIITKKKAPKPKIKIKLEDPDIKVVLFDLNGTLCLHENRDTVYPIVLRPCIDYLKSLTTHYVVGVYTSLMMENAIKIIAMIEHKCKCTIFDRRYIFFRENTIPFKTKERELYNIPEWKTKKCLGKIFTDVSQVTVVDDDISKIQEKHRAIIIPTFTNHENSASDVELANVVSKLLKPFSSFIP
jgi:hypothetical protein